MKNTRRHRAGRSGARERGAEGSSADGPLPPGAGGAQPEDARRMEEGRGRIDAIDDELLRLLNERARYARVIGAIKKRLGLPVYSAEREMEILARVTDRNRGPLERDAIRRLFERIIDESRRLERLAAQEPEPRAPAEE